MVLPTLSTPSVARGPDGISDVAERVIDAVVNISTSQKVGSAQHADAAVAATIRSWTSCSGTSSIGAARTIRRTAKRGPRRVNSLGSGFVIDAAGIVVTNNHVIAEADEITVILNDGTRA